jgi:hypothetical protein
MYIHTRFFWSYKSRLTTLETLSKSSNTYYCTWHIFHRWLPLLVIGAEYKKFSNTSLVDNNFGRCDVIFWYAIFYCCVCVPEWESAVAWLAGMCASPEMCMPNYVSQWVLHQHHGAITSWLCSPRQAQAQEAAALPRHLPPDQAAAAAHRHPLP